jgi:hypothetical protein
METLISEAATAPDFEIARTLFEEYAVGSASTSAFRTSVKNSNGYGRSSAVL